jgi:hypothetical protein
MILAMRAGSLRSHAMKIASKPPSFSKIRRGTGTFPAEIPTTAEPNHHLSPSFPRNPLSPPAAPVQGRLQGPPAKSKFLAVMAWAFKINNWGTIFRRSIFVAASMIYIISVDGELIISEFLAENCNDILDEDGISSDWIEIHNPSGVIVPLGGYSLTDDQTDPAKWSFPAMDIAPGEFLRVFASGKDRVSDPSLLHTNFKLRAQGEYLALVKPEGRGIAYEFGPNFPPQFEDLSYGSGLTVTEVILPIGADLTYLVPSEDIGIEWQLPGFDDTSWTSAQSAVGFNYNGEVGALIGERGDVGGAMKAVNGSLYVRLPFEVEDPQLVDSLNLATKVDDGYVAYLNGHEVAAKNKPPIVTWSSLATNGEEVEAGDPYENMVLQIDGKLVQGENILAVQVLNERVNSGDLIFAPILSMDRSVSESPFSVGYLSAPTPGTLNGSIKSAPPSAVTFDVTGRVFRQEFEVSLNVAESGATIRYTVDGAIPDADSPIYENPLSISSSTLLRARAFLPDTQPGKVGSEGYVRISESEAEFSSNLPVVVLTTFGNGWPPGTGSSSHKEVYLLVYEPEIVTGLTNFDSEPSIATRGGFRIRGSSSSNFAKYPLAFESWDENNRDHAIEPLGFAPDADWMFNSRYSFDLSLIRNRLIYALSNQMGRWAAGTRSVELFNDVNGGEIEGADYFGVYSFMERIEAGEGRLDITELSSWGNEPEKLTGGYVFKADRQSPGQPTFEVAGFGIEMVFVDPDWRQSSSEQRSYLHAITNEVTVALVADDGVNPETGMHFSDYLDVDSFIDNFWLTILPMAPDWGHRSQYFHKNRDGKINAGPVWDFDRTMGSREGRDDDPRRWEGNTDQSSLTWFDSEHVWFGLLFGFGFDDDEVRNMQDPQLRTSRPDIFQKVIDRWYSLRENEFSQSNIESIIDEMADELRLPQARNFSRWSSLSPGAIPFRQDFSLPGVNGWEREISHLKGWLKARTEWIDEQFFGPPSFNENGGEVDEGFQLTMTANEGDVYYSLNNEDPRGLGGLPSATAVMGSILTLTETSTVTARTYDGEQWGAPRKEIFVVGGAVADKGNLVVSEIMYSPVGPTEDEIAAGFLDANQFEFIELLNTSDFDVSLSGVSFVDGIQFDFNNASITLVSQGERVLVVRDRAALLSRYGQEQSSRIAGEFENETGLSRGGERIVLTGLNGTIVDLTYDSSYPWAESADGMGPSVVLIKPESGGDINSGFRWRPSVAPLGSPGSGGSSVALSGDPLTDSDGDGLSAMIEYALGLDDGVPDDGSEVLNLSIDANGFFTISFVRDLAADDVEIELQVSSNLRSWSAMSGEVEFDGEDYHGDGTITYRFSQTSVDSLEDRSLFFRLRAILR